MTKLLILSVALITLNACDPAATGKAKTQEDMIVAANKKLSESGSVSDVTKSVLSDRVQTVKANLTTEEKKEMYTSGCKVAGADSSTIYQLDPETQVDDQYRGETIREMITLSKSHNISTNTVREIRPDFISIETNYETLNLSEMPLKKIDEVFKKKPHSISEKTYDFQGELYPKINFDFSKTYENLTPEANSFLQSDLLQNPNEWYCHVDYNSSQKNNQTTDKINYNFMGRPTEAFLTKSETKGDVTCELFERFNPKVAKTIDFDRKALSVLKMGAGTLLRVKITSNKFKAFELMSCGGEKLYESEILTLDSGKILSSEVTKKLTSPARMRQ